MAPGSRCSRRQQLLVAVAVVLLLAAAPTGCSAARSKKSYEAIFSFGDSLSDAGNLIADGIPKSLTTARAPYGMTFFGRPTGRCSNGRLVVDFLGNTLAPRPWRLFFLLSLSWPCHRFTYTISLFNGVILQ
jgi:hypothetical protein